MHYLLNATMLLDIIPNFLKISVADVDCECSYYNASFIYMTDDKILNSRKIRGAQSSFCFAAPLFVA